MSRPQPTTPREVWDLIANRDLKSIAALTCQYDSQADAQLAAVHLAVRDYHTEVTPTTAGPATLTAIKRPKSGRVYPAEEYERKGKK